MIEIIIPTIKGENYKECIACIRKNTSIPYKIITADKGNSWLEAINFGLSICSKEHDVVFMDDDVRVLPGWDNIPSHFFSSADIFGYRLIRPSGLLDHCGGIITLDFFRGLYGVIKNKRNEFPFFGITVRGNLEKDIRQFTKPCFLPHCTTSLLYIKKEVIQHIPQIPTLHPEGRYHEDWAFSFNALKKGFKILYLPKESIHFNCGTKRKLTDLNKKSLLNYSFLQDQFLKKISFRHLLWRNGFIKIKLFKTYLS